MESFNKKSICKQSAFKNRIEVKAGTFARASPSSHIQQQ